jgi:hypothetical protein
MCLHFLSHLRYLEFNNKPQNKAIFSEFRKDPNLKTYIVIQQSVIFLFSLDIFQQIQKTPMVRQGARWAPLKIEKVESNKDEETESLSKTALIQDSTFLRR